MWDRKAERIAKYNRKKQNTSFKEIKKGNKTKAHDSKQNGRTRLLRNQNRL